MASQRARVPALQVPHPQCYLPLAGTEGAFVPFFSPDGQDVGFFAGNKLKKVSVERGKTTVLCDVSFRLGGSWGDDGNIVAGLSLASGLSRIPAGGGAVDRLTELKPGEGIISS